MGCAGTARLRYHRRPWALRVGDPLREEELVSQGAERVLRWSFLLPLLLLVAAILFVALTGGPAVSGRAKE